MGKPDLRSRSVGCQILVGWGEGTFYLDWVGELRARIYLNGTTNIYYMPGSFPGRRYIVVPPTKMSSLYLYKPQRKLGKKRVSGNKEKLK